MTDIVPASNLGRPKDELATKRSILISARIRFAPESQPIRETAIDKILEQSLLASDAPQGLTAKEIDDHRALCFPGGVPALSRVDVRASLERLVHSGRILPDGSLGRKRYRLSPKTRSELSALQVSAEHRFNQVVHRLFPDADDPVAQYSAPFLDCLCLIFSRLGDVYVSLLRGDATSDDLVDSPIAIAALAEVQARHRLRGDASFRRGVVQFFYESHPDYDLIKWNMAQNYYVFKALGYGTDGRILSGELFGAAVLCADTNVLIEALEPRARYHGSFKALAAACRKLGIEFRACQISVDELRRVAQAQRVMLEKVASQIPVSTAQKVRGIFFELYREEFIARGKVDLDALFAPFLHPMQRLEPMFGFELNDSMWFDGAADRPEAQAIADKISSNYEARRGRKKSRSAVAHDAQLLYWAQSQRLALNRNVWVVTLDRSLIGVVPSVGTGPTRPLAVTLDALLQWISPIALLTEAEDGIAGIFAQAVKQRLLPQETFFDLKDFLVFAEMELACRELPAEDVEACIQHVKKEAPHLDPSNPSDREKISRHISRFLVDPGRKFKRELERLETQLDEERAAQSQKDANAAAAIEERDRQIADLVDQRASDTARSANRKVFRKRMAGAIAAFVATTGAVTYLASEFADGQNFIQRLIAWWPFVGGSAGIGVTAGFAILRGARWQTAFRKALTRRW